MKSISICLLAGLLCAACGGGGGSSPSADPPPPPAPPAPFGFQTVDDVDFRVVVTRDGLPLVRAHVSIVDELVPPTNGQPLEDVTTGGTYYQGYTDDDGRILCPVPLPLTVQAVDVIIDARGTVGPYTHESLRQTWGPFSPSARVRVPVADLGQLEFQLTRE